MVSRTNGETMARLGATLHAAVATTTVDTTTGDTPTGEVLAHDLTPSVHHDGPELPGLLAKLKGPVQAVCADGACDADHNHAAILARGATPIVGATPFVGQWIPRIQPCCASLPPRKGAAISPPPGMKDPPPQLAMRRGAAVRRIAGVGRKEWKKATRYHRRSLSQTSMYRDKAIIGPTLRSRTLPNQKTAGRRRRAVPEPVHRARHAHQHQDRLKSGGKRELCPKVGDGVIRRL